MFKRTIVITISLFAFIGCFRPLNYWLATGEDKHDMLVKSVKDLHQSLHWGDVPGVLKFIEPSKRQLVAHKIPKDDRSVQYLEGNIVGTEEDSDTGYTIVRVKIKTYITTSLKVTEQVITEEWDYYRFGGGWVLKSSEIFPEL